MLKIVWNNHVSNDEGLDIRPLIVNIRSLKYLRYIRRKEGLGIVILTGPIKRKRDRGNNI